MCVWGRQQCWTCGQETQTGTDYRSYSYILWEKRGSMKSIGPRWVCLNKYIAVGAASLCNYTQCDSYIKSLFGVWSIDCAAVACYGALMETGLHANLWEALLPVKAISATRRCGVLNPLCAHVSFNVESMKATFRWKVLSGQRWCPFRSPSFLSSRHTVSQNIHAEFPVEFILEKVSVVFCSCNGNTPVLVNFLKQSRWTRQRKHFEEETNCRIDRLACLWKKKKKKC